MIFVGFADPDAEVCLAATEPVMLHARAFRKLEGGEVLRKQGYSEQNCGILLKFWNVSGCGSDSFNQGEGPY